MEVLQHVEVGALEQAAERHEGRIGQQEGVAEGERAEAREATAAPPEQHQACPPTAMASALATLSASHGPPGQRKPANTVLEPGAS